MRSLMKKKAIGILLIITTLVSFPSIANKVSDSASCLSRVIEPRYFNELDFEKFPVEPIKENEISFEKFNENKGVVYEVNSCRGSGLPFEVFKYKNGSIDFGIEYIYESNLIPTIKVIYLNGKPTTYRMMQEI